MELDLESKGWAVFGLPDSGKSTLVNYILNQYGPQAFIYDTLNEYGVGPYDSYAPRGRYDADELQDVIRLAMKRYQMIAIDEANRFCPPKPAPLPQAIADLNDWRAHYGISTGYVCRRPVQLNQDLTELAHYLFIFSLQGKNDGQYLNDLSDGLGDMVQQLQPYHFVIVDPQRHYQVSPPVPASFATDKKL